jgi:hypothetical protein
MRSDRKNYRAPGCLRKKAQVCAFHPHKYGRPDYPLFVPSPPLLLLPSRLKFVQ